MNYIIDYLSKLFIDSPQKKTIQHPPLYIYQSEVNNLECIHNKVNQYNTDLAHNLSLLDNLIYHGDHFARCFNGQLIKVLVNVDWKIPCNQFKIQRLYECLIIETFPIDITYHYLNDTLIIELHGKRFYNEKFYMFNNNCAN